MIAKILYRVKSSFEVMKIERRLTIAYTAVFRSLANALFRINMEDRSRWLDTLTY